MRTNIVLDGSHLLPGLPTGMLHDLVDPARADLDPVQVMQGKFHPNVAHVLFLAKIHHRRFQPRPKGPFQLQSGLPCPAVMMRTSRRMAKKTAARVARAARVKMIFSGKVSIRPIIQSKKKKMSLRSFYWGQGGWNAGDNQSWWLWRTKLLG